MRNVAAGHAALRIWMLISISMTKKGGWLRSVFADRAPPAIIGKLQTRNRTVSNISSQSRDIGAKQDRHLLFQ
jgi:hypothetical protein